VSVSIGGDDLVVILPAATAPPPAAGAEVGLDWAAEALHEMEPDA